MSYQLHKLLAEVQNAAVGVKDILKLLEEMNKKLDALRHLEKIVEQLEWLLQVEDAVRTKAGHIEERLMNKV